MEKTIKLYLSSIHPELNQDELQAKFNKLALTLGTGAAGGLVASILTCFEKSHIVNGMDYISSLIDLDRQIAES